MEVKHTPGPWTVHRHHKPISDQWIFTVITDEEYGSVICGTCTAPQWLDEDSRQANAALIAAAPDLLEALEFVAEIDASGAGDSVIRFILAAAQHKARAAIAKAKGEEQ